MQQQVVALKSIRGRADAAQRLQQAEATSRAAGKQVASLKATLMRVQGERNRAVKTSNAAKAATRTAKAEAQSLAGQLEEQAAEEQPAPGTGEAQQAASGGASLYLCSQCLAALVAPRHSQLRRAGASLFALQKRTKGKGGKSWPWQIVELILELLAGGVPPSAIPSAIAASARLMQPGVEVKVPTVRYCQALRRVLCGVAETLAAYRVGKMLAWRALATQRVERCLQHSSLPWPPGAVTLQALGCATHARQDAELRRTQVRPDRRCQLCGFNTQATDGTSSPPDPDPELHHLWVDAGEAAV